MTIRYGAAYLSTLICVAAAQLYIPTPLALLLAGVTILGLPLSLSLRAALARPGKPPFNRAYINRTIVMLTFVSSFVFLHFQGPQLFGSAGARTSLLLETTRPISLLMQVFLIFAVCRCLAIVHDKDAILCAVPSFSVLLLLIVLHKGPEVVLYFLLWMFVTALLFALDHRSDARLGINGFVPAALPGQDAVLSARALVGVLGLSLVLASVLSYFLVSRDPNQRGTLESSIVQLASRLGGLGDLNDVSVNSGPERQIDFSSGPALPTRTPLWEVRAVAPDGKGQYQPQYWRLFTLARYDGHSWSQTPGSGSSVEFGPLSWRAWPMFAPSRMNRRLNRPLSQTELEQRAQRQKAYDIAVQGPGGETAMALFGTPTTPVLQSVKALEASSGYLPVLPSLRALRFPSSFSRSMPPLRVRRDRAVDIGVLENNRYAFVLSDLPALPEYGARGNGVPTKLSVKPNPQARLSDRERAIYLQLPEGEALPQRVRDFARSATSGAAPEENSLRHAQRLAVAIQRAAIYTLRPPATPASRDAVDYFLFDSGRGYCTYFASALTVLCRTQGIPARMVSGFTNTEWSVDPQGYNVGLIREANAHTWTEVWVDGWGWASVDATPADDRGDNAPTMWNNFGSVVGDALSGAWKWMGAHRGFVVGALVLILIVSVTFFWRGGPSASSAWIRARLHPQRPGNFGADDDATRSAIFQSYRSASQNLARQFRRRAPWETPREWFALGAAVLEPQSAAPLQTLAELHTRASYSLRPLSGE